MKKQVVIIKKKKKKSLTKIKTFSVYICPEEPFFLGEVYCIYP